MSHKTRLLSLTAGAVGLGLLLGASAASAQNVIFGDPSFPTKATAIRNLNVNGTTYDVEFIYSKAASSGDVYGPLPGNYDFNTSTSANAAVKAVNAALNGQDARFVGDENSRVNIDLLSEIYLVGFNRGPDIGPAASVDTWSGSIPDLTWVASFENVIYSDARTWARFTAKDDGGNGSVDLTGKVQDESGTPLCSLALASGQFMFTCNPNGPFQLLDLPTASDGTVKRQVYVDGFFPNVETLSGSSNDTVVMRRASNCPDYNSFPQPGEFPNSSGKRINVSGKVLLQNTQTAVCAMVLGNGQFDFTCDGSGSYSGNIPLDAKGQYKLQVYADGFAPMIQAFDEFTPNVEVRLARANECD